jgi:hypothetical protein
MTAERLRLRKEHMETIYKLQQERNLKEKLEKELKENAQSIYARKEVTTMCLWMCVCVRTHFIYIFIFDKTKLAFFPPYSRIE